MHTPDGQATDSSLQGEPRNFTHALQVADHISNPSSSSGISSTSDGSPRNTDSPQSTSSGSDNPSQSSGVSSREQLHYRAPESPESGRHSAPLSFPIYDGSDFGGSRSAALCLVCGDRASGKHYGVQSCDGCRGFFKRSIRRNLQYVCKERGACVVDVARRNQCQACRLKKCLLNNMNKDAVQHERAPRAYQFSGDGLSSPVGSSNVGTGYYMQQLLDSPRFPADYIPRYQPHHTFLYDSSYRLRQPPLGSVPMGLPGDTPAATPTHGLKVEGRLDSRGVAGDESGGLGSSISPNPSLITGLETSPPSVPQPIQFPTFSPSTGHQVPMTDSHLRPLPAVPILRLDSVGTLVENARTELQETAAKLLFMTVKWARNIPSFLQLPFRDQAILLEESWSELFLLSAAQWSLKPDFGAVITAAQGNLNNRQTTQGLHVSIRVLQDFLSRCSQQHIDTTEYACLKALVLFRAEVRGLRDPSKVEGLQDQAQLMLHEYTLAQYPSNKVRFGRMLLLLPALHAIGPECVEEVFFRKTLGDLPIERLLCDMFKSS